MKLTGPMKWKKKLFPGLVVYFSKTGFTCVHKLSIFCFIFFKVL